MGSTFVSENKVSISGFLEKSVHFSVFGKKCPFIGYASFCPFYLHYPRNMQIMAKYPIMSKYPNGVKYGLYRHPERMEGFYWLLTLIFDLVYFGLFWFTLVYFGSFWSTVSWPILVYFPYWYCMEWSIWAILPLYHLASTPYELYIALCNEPYMKD